MQLFYMFQTLQGFYALVLLFFYDMVSVTFKYVLASFTLMLIVFNPAVYAGLRGVCFIV